ncbi:hypothetical protein U9M48_017164 [Paspalum notatum var. saurae]|uniref:Uncharacterized protein n=1 Tax=Paspalum notatum var. saurae TaxID=547442 RepID=A0AAQ3WNX2_PASNO
MNSSDESSLCLHATPALPKKSGQIWELYTEQGSEKSWRHDQNWMNTGYFYYWCNSSSIPILTPHELAPGRQIRRRAPSHRGSVTAGAAGARLLPSASGSPPCESASSPAGTGLVLASTAGLAASSPAAAEGRAWGRPAGEEARMAVGEGTADGGALRGTPAAEERQEAARPPAGKEAAG